MNVGVLAAIKVLGLSRLGLIAIVLASGIGFVSYSVHGVSADYYVTSVVLYNHNPWPVTIESVQVTGYEQTNNILLLNATTPYSYTIPANSEQTITLNVYVNPLVHSLPSDTQVHAVVHIDYKDGALSQTINIDTVLTVAQIEQAAQQI